MPIKLTNLTVEHLHGCYHCFSLFRKEEIHTWYDGGVTAECPCCGIDSVIIYATCRSISEILHDLRETAETCNAKDFPDET